MAGMDEGYEPQPDDEMVEWERYDPDNPSSGEGGLFYWAGLLGTYAITALVAICVLAAALTLTVLFVRGCWALST